MTGTVRVIASCTERKRWRDQAIRLRDVRARSLEQRAHRWWRVLQERSDAAVLTARQLYQGEHWSIVRSLERGQFRCDLWVASAGYGLLPIGACLHPYAATFAVPHEDSVALATGAGPQSLAENQTWWQALAMEKGPGGDEMRSIAGLAASARQQALMVVGSPTYIMAMERDLLAARAELADADRLIIISSVAPASCRLADNWVVTNARLQSRVGGSLMALNARIARMILRETRSGELYASCLKQRLARTLAQMPDRRHQQRVRLADAQVAGFITEELTVEPGVSATRLLQRLRAAGQSCEQQRFKRIYQEVDEVLLSR